MLSLFFTFFFILFGKLVSLRKLGCFVGLLFLGKLNTNDLLQRQKSILSSSPGWYLMQDREEPVECGSPVFHYPFSYKLWCLFHKELGTVWVFPRSLNDSVVSGFCNALGNRRKCLGKVALLALF